MRILTNTLASSLLMAPSVTHLALSYVTGAPVEQVATAVVLVLTQMFAVAMALSLTG